MSSRKSGKQKKDARAAIVFGAVVAVLLLALALLLWRFILRPAGEAAPAAPGPSAAPTASPAPTQPPFTPRTVTIRAVAM